MRYWWVNQNQTCAHEISGGYLWSPKRKANKRLEETERRALILARRGQGLFRANVQSIERACRITKVDRCEHLVASHIKPWRDSSNDERLKKENGLLLTPSIDHLFDKGFISFESDGELIVSPVADRASLHRMGVPIDRRISVGAFLRVNGNISITIETIFSEFGDVRGSETVRHVQVPLGGHDPASIPFQFYPD